MQTTEKAKFNWCLGPDVIYPATSCTTTKLDGAVKIKTEKKHTDSEIISLYTRFKNTVEKAPKHSALSNKLFKNKSTNRRMVNFGTKH